MAAKNANSGASAGAAPGVGSRAYQFIDHTFDVVVVGAGGAGLRATLGASQAGLKTACISKVFPTRSHTVAAQGGISAALGNMGEDDWRWHMYDTVKGSDWLGDQDAIEYLCRNAPAAVYELDHFGVPFSRTEEGKIYQRPFGGMTTRYGEGAAAQRTCAAADRTGHAILHTLYGQSLKNNAQFFIEYFALDLITDEDGTITGVIAWNLDDGTMHRFRAKMVVMATGGYGRAYFSCTSAHTCTGDGGGMVARAGLPLQDMEFVQFHPTGIYGAGCLITEGARGEGGYLLNGKEERFMEAYAPVRMELAPRDIVARAEQSEIDAGRGWKGEGCIALDLRHLGEARIMERLPQIRQLGIDFIGVDCIKEPLPIQPSAHYSMGGIPADMHGQVVMDSRNTPLQGFFAAGECACISVHGANRLGTNSLLDATVFGERAGRSAAEYARSVGFGQINEGHEKARVLKQIEEIFQRPGTENYNDIRNEMKDTMMEKCGVFRDDEKLTDCLQQVRTLQARYKKGRITDKGKIFNSELYEIIELGNMLKMAEIITAGALNRKESRGGHYRTDFPKRDDESFLHHTLIAQDGEELKLDKKPVIITKYPPKERTY